MPDVGSATRACLRWSASGQLRRSFSTTDFGPFSDDVSVDGRMKVFNDLIEQLLWPEKRVREPGFDGFIVRTTEPSYINVQKRTIAQVFSDPELKNLAASRLGQRFEQVFGLEGSFERGPIPKGSPINLWANFQPREDIPDGQRLPHDQAFSQLTSDMSVKYPDLDQFTIVENCAARC